MIITLTPTVISKHKKIIIQSYDENSNSYRTKMIATTYINKT